jgi:DNA-binding winged helix-turn-helix (wHTH) protein
VLTPKAYELLCVLVEMRPRAIPKSELHERLWPSTFVSEATLASLVAELREALGEQGRHGRFIRTVHGFGYAFSGLARENGAPDPERVAAWIVYEGRENSLEEGEHVIGRDVGVAVALGSSTSRAIMPGSQSGARSRSSRTLGVRTAPFCAGGP